MSAAQGKILLAGGTGALGRAVADHLKPDMVIIGSRRPPVNGFGGHREYAVVDSSGSIRRHDLDGVEVLLNCAGRVQGTAQELREANVNFPLQLAICAKAAGIRRFVHISSFSVYGAQAGIDGSSWLSPTSDYGRSKLDGELAILALNSDGFKVTIIRLPFLFSATSRSLLKSLFKAVKTAGFLPVPPDPVRRSMLTLADAGHFIGTQVGEMNAGVLHMADPTLFDFDLMADIFAEVIGRRTTLVKCPKLLFTLAGVAVPRLRTSLYSSSVLAPEINALNSVTMTCGLYTEMKALLTQLKTITA